MHKWPERVYPSWHALRLRLAAAECDVRVHLLIDDIDTAGEDLGLATPNAHPNIQITHFRP